MKFVSKPGVHGTLYRYAVTYTDRSDNGCPEFVWYTRRTKDRSKPSLAP